MPDVETKPAEGTKDATPGAQGDGKDVPFHEHPRWKEVYGAYQDYKKLGKADDIAARLREADELKTAVQDAIKTAEEDAKKTPDSKKSEADKKAARDVLRELLPEIDELQALKDGLQATWSRREHLALVETKKVMREMDLDPSDDKELNGVAEVLSDIIKNDRDLWAEYEVDPRAAVRGARDRLAKYTAKSQSANDRSKAADRQAEREKTKTLPKAHGAGGGEAGGSESTEPPKNLAEATKRAMARLRGMEF